MAELYNDMVRVYSLKYTEQGKAQINQNRREKHMELDYFKDMIFDLMNEADSIDIANIESDDANNTYTVSTSDESVFEVECRKIK